APGGGSKNPKPKTVLRAGVGIFYDRFGLQNSLSARRYNGVVEQQYVVADPDFFPAVPPLATLAGAQSIQTIRQLSASLRTPYFIQSAAGVERQLPHNTTVAVTYANAHGLHLLRSDV